MLALLSKRILMQTLQLIKKYTIKIIVTCILSVYNDNNNLMYNLFAFNNNYYGKMKIQVFNHILLISKRNVFYQKTSVS